MPGNLVVVGSGIQSVGHITLEAQGWIQNADKVLYCVADPVTARWIKQNARPNSEPEDLMSYYPTPPAAPTPETFKAMASRIAHWVSKGLTVCAVFYGHPSIIVYPGHMVTAWATRQPDIKVRMIPGISALDCLLADRHIDPVDTGFQMFEAYEFLERRERPQGRPPTLDPYCHVVFWQIGLLEQRQKGTMGPVHTLHELRDVLSSYYDPTKQEIIHYQRPQLPIFRYFAPAHTLYLADLPTLQTLGQMTGASMLYIPPLGYQDIHGTWEPATDIRGQVTWETATPGLVPMTPGEPTNRRLDQVAANLHAMATDPARLADYVDDPTRLVTGAGAGLDDTTKNTLKGDDVMAILKVLEGLVPLQPLTQPQEEGTGTDQPAAMAGAIDSAIAGAIEPRAAAPGSVNAQGVW